MSLKAICPVKASTKALKAGLQVGIQSAFRHIGSTANCTLNLPLRKHIFFAGNSKLKITRSVKTISQPKRERCSLLVMGSWFQPVKIPVHFVLNFLKILVNFNIFT